ncbi:Protein of unknown function [Gryllus bimaculatus]|nr:Protein of unknown function [Gryllus bimaculatus]
MASRKTRQSKRDASPALRSRAATAAAAQAAALAADPHPLAAPHVSLAGTYGLHEMRKVFFFVSLIGSNNHINRKYKSKNICNGIVLINV